MASLNGATVTIQELNAQQNLLDYLLWIPQQPTEQP